VQCQALIVCMSVFAGHDIHVLTAREHFVDERVGNAVYAHAWDPNGTRLFACGGPLAFGLRGSYMACWE